MLAYLLNQWLNRVIVNEQLPEITNIQSEVQESKSETEWMTIGRAAKYIGKSYDWVQSRLSEFDDYSAQLPDNRNHLRKNYPGWAIDLLKADADKLQDYPLVTAEDISKNGLSELIKRDEKWIDARLPYLGIDSTTKLNPSNNRLFEYFDRNEHAPLLVAEDERMKSYPIASEDESTVEGIAKILNVDRKRVVRRLSFINTLPVVKRSPATGQLYGYYSTTQVLEELSNLGERSLHKKPHHPSEAHLESRSEPTNETLGIKELEPQPSLKHHADRKPFPLQSSDVRTENWTEYALCAETDPDLFIDVRTKREIRLAKRVCEKCVAKLFCLDYAVVNNEQDGIWGGLTGKERENLQVVN